MSLKDIYTYNKKTIWIGIVTIIVLVIGLVIYFQKEDTREEGTTEIVFKDEYDLILFGDDIEIYQNEKYQEPGFYAILNNDIVTEEVKVDNPVDSSKPGIYVITYTYRTIEKTRTVTVLENSTSSDTPSDSSLDTEENKTITLKLVGSSEITLRVGEVYKEQGASATDQNGKDISSEIKISGTINTNQVGTYTIRYMVTKEGVTKSLERTIRVVKNTILEVTEPNQIAYTNKDIVVTVQANGSNFLYLKLPDNTVSRDSKREYTITENGTYTFQAYDRDNSVQTKTITVKSIDKIKPSGTCTATVQNSKTTIKVVASDNIGIDHYLYNGTNTSNSNTYTVNSILKTASVSVYDKAGNVTSLSCSVVTNSNSSGGTDSSATTPVQAVDDGNLEIHFMLSGHDDDAILIRTNRKTIMIDGGRYEDKQYVIPYLQDLGVTKIDLLIGSHVQYNHIQAQGAIIDTFPVEKAIYSIDLFNCKKNGLCNSDDIKYVLDSLKKKNIPTEMKVPGDYIELGEMKLYFIGPVLPNKKHNKNSFVFLLKFRETTYMFTGDCSNSVLDTAKFEANASKWGLNINVDVLKWPHHGYNDLTDTFFKATTPKYAIIPNGSHCSSKYPSSNNKNLMKKYGTTYYQTCEYKNIVLISDGKNIDIKGNQKASDYKR